MSLTQGRITNGVHPRTPSVILSDREAQQSGRSATDRESARDAEQTGKHAMTAFGGCNVELDGFSKRKQLRYCCRTTRGRSLREPHGIGLDATEVKIQILC